MIDHDLYIIYIFFCLNLQLNKPYLNIHTPLLVIYQLLLIEENKGAFLSIQNTGAVLKSF